MVWVIKSSNRMRSARDLAHAAWFAFPIRILGRHRDLESAQAIFAGHSRRVLVQHVVHKIPELQDVCVRKTCEVMVSQRLRAAILSQKSRGRLLEASHQDRSGGAYDLGANIVAIG